MSLELPPDAYRRKDGIAKVKKRVDIPADLIYRFEKLPEHYNPATGEPHFGHWSTIMSELLRAYILEKEAQLGKVSI